MTTSTGGEAACGAGWTKKQRCFLGRQTDSARPAAARHDIVAMAPTRSTRSWTVRDLRQVAYGSAVRFER